MTISKKRFEFTTGTRPPSATDFTKIDLNLFKKEQLQEKVTAPLPPKVFLTPSLKSIKLKEGFGLDLKSVQSRVPTEAQKKYVKHAVGTFQKYLGYLAPIDEDGVVEAVCQELVELDTDKLLDIILNPIALGFDLTHTLDNDYREMGECLSGKDIKPIDKNAIANITGGVIVNTYGKDGKGIDSYFNALVSKFDDPEIQHRTIQQTIQQQNVTGNARLLRDVLSYETPYPKITDQLTLDKTINNLNLPSDLNSSQQHTLFTDILSLVGGELEEHLDLSSSILSTTNEQIKTLSSKHMLTDANPYEVLSLDTIPHKLIINQSLSQYYSTPA